MTEAVASLVQNWSQGNRKYDFSILISPNFCYGNNYFYTKEVWNTMGEMSPKVHGKDSFTLVRLISIKSVYTKIIQLLQIFKPDKNNISWFSN